MCIIYDIFIISLYWPACLSVDVFCPILLCSAVPVPRAGPVITCEIVILVWGHSHPGSGVCCSPQPGNWSNWCCKHSLSYHIISHHITLYHIISQQINTTYLHHPLLTMSSQLGPKQFQLLPKFLVEVIRPFSVFKWWWVKNRSLTGDVDRSYLYENQKRSWLDRKYLGIWKILSGTLYQ